MSKSRTYSNDDLTILWQPDKCIHAGICVKKLPKVYRPKERPWIQIDNGTTEEIKDQIKACPSGALSYTMNDEENKESHQLETKVEVLENGPLLIYGTLKVTDQDGVKEIKNKTTAFCRCGVSKNKPYCDGSHIKVDFKG